MNAQLVQDIADAVLYEGYLLYPYRPSALKNRRRFTFGVLAPRDECEAVGAGQAWFTQAECLTRVVPDARLNVRVRFLHLTDRVAGKGTTPWQEAVPCDVHLSTLVAETVASPLEHAFRVSAIEGCVHLTLSTVADGLIKIRLRISNVTPLRCLLDGSEGDSLLQSLAATHAILNVEGGQFLSLMDPPEELRSAAAACQNIGTWPVLVGEDAATDAMLSSPIILYDYPRIAPESPGALFDGTEIDEILALRILTMTDAEKQEMRDSDPRGRAILERTERLSPEHWQQLHGVMREPRALEDERS